MSIKEKKERMARNRAINSKKTPRSPFVKWALAHQGALIINDPELKANLSIYVE